MTKLDKYFLTLLKKDKKIDTYLPTEVVYSDEGLKPWVGGTCTYGFFSNYIQIREKYRNDKGILKHELTHARQYGNLLWLHLLLKYSDKYTLFIELDAYREQIKQYNYNTKDQYSWVIDALTNKDKYNLDIQRKEATEYADFMFGDLIKN